MATWDYKLKYEHLDESIFTDEWIWRRLRRERNKRLAECDYQVLTDAVGDIEAWKEYRQALRDLPANTIDPREADWPIEPK